MDEFDIDFVPVMVDLGADDGRRRRLGGPAPSDELRRTAAGGRAGRIGRSASRRTASSMPAPTIRCCCSASWPRWARSRSRPCSTRSRRSPISSRSASIAAGRSRCVSPTVTEAHDRRGVRVRRGQLRSVDRRRSTAAPAPASTPASPVPTLTDRLAAAVTPPMPATKPPADAESLQLCRSRRQR